MKKLFIFLMLIAWIMALFSISASAQDTVKVYVTEWDFIKVTRDTTFTQNKAGLTLLETPNNQDYEVTVSYKKKVVIPPVPVITTVNDNELTYTGAWVPSVGATWSITYSSTPGATAKYSFTGNHVDVFGTFAPHHGVLEYAINSGTPKSINLASPVRQDGVLMISEPVPAGFNTISFKCVSGTVLIDYLRITK